MAKNGLSKSVDSLLSQALAIEAESAQEAGALGFMARAMVQATLPHRKVSGNEFVRTNGAFTLSLVAPSAIGLPYGSIPRLLLAWVTTEAVRTQSRELELGDSMGAFMAELGLSRTGGDRGDITRFKEQARRLFNSMVSTTYQADNRTDDIGFRLAERTMLWWSKSDPQQASLWRSSVTLSEPFYREVVDRPVPIDMRAMRALKQSPMALDIYAWATYRASYLKKPTAIPWDSLALQFGADYSRRRDFKAAFLNELKKVYTIYSGIRVETTDEGILIKPAPPHIARRQE